MTVNATPTPPTPTATVGPSPSSNGHHKHSKPSRRSPDQIRQQIIAGLGPDGIQKEFADMGVVFVGKARASGKIECYSRERGESGDRKPSAYVDLTTGHYAESSGSKESLSFFDFAVKYGRFPDWKAARDHYAALVGVAVGKRKKSTRPEDSLDFQPWTDGNKRLAELWCARSKRGTTLEAILAFGGRVANYFWTDDGGVRHPIGKVIALPCWNHNLLAVDPVAWVLWRTDGQQFEQYQGKDQFGNIKEPKRAKMLSVGPTSGTLMNESALHNLTVIRADENRRQSVAWVVKTAGPSDAMAVWSALPEEARERVLVICNASGETGDVPIAVAKLFTGLRVLVAGDADTPGQFGQLKWAVALAPHASEVRLLKLPYEVAEKHGKDLRWWLTEWLTERMTERQSETAGTL